MHLCPISNVRVNSADWNTANPNSDSNVQSGFFRDKYPLTKWISLVD